MNKNPNCDGGHCHAETGKVRVFRLGAGGNLLLCRACWEQENQFRHERGRKTGNPQGWPQRNWHTAEVYES